MLKVLFIDLFFNPRKFFKEQLSFCEKYYIWFIYLVGICNHIEHFDNLCVRAEIQGGKRFELLSSMSWLKYWVFVLLFGALSGMIIWLVAGWWYKIRIKWSGAKQPDPFESRLICIFSSFVYAAPVIVIYLSTSFFFKNPWEAYSFNFGNSYIEIISGIPSILFYFWSVFVSYLGVTTRFNLVKWKAKLWFITLPIIMQVVLFFGIVSIYHHLYSQQ